ncbi:MAG: toxin-antitoxin system YwqK family antitoxin [Candidatus Firestonebacteria bacterium]
METTERLWDKNRVLKTEFLSDNGLLSKFRWFSEPKKIRYEVSYVDWQLHGIEKGWYENEQQEYEITYSYGIKQGIEKQWYKNGFPKYEVSWLGHIKHGLERKWYENGQIEFELSYNKGVFHGINKKWYENGNQKSELSYINGRFHGLVKEWYPDGESKLEVLFIDGRKHGLEKGVIRMTAKGFERFEILNDNGQIHGTAKYYDRMDNLVKEETYFRGVKIPKEIYFYPEKIKAEQIIAEPNAEVRRIMLELMGYEKFLTQMPHCVVHKKGEYSLVRINRYRREEENIMLLKAKCSSSGVWYTLRVPPDMKTCKEALAWTFNISPKEYVLEEEA